MDGMDGWKDLGWAPMGDGMKLRAAEQHIGPLRQTVAGTLPATLLRCCSYCMTPVDDQCCRTACGPLQWTQSYPVTDGTVSPNTTCRHRTVYVPV